MSEVVVSGPTNGNIMPALSEQQYAALKASIEKNGVLVPIEVDEETGELLDGFHRQRICAELGIEPPVQFRTFGGDKERKEHALTLNLMRRQLGPISWAASFKQLTEVRGVRLERGARNDNTTSATVAEVAEEVGVKPRTARYRLQLAQDLEDAPDLALKVDAGEMDAKKALKTKREREQRRKTEGQPPVTRAELQELKCDIRHCDFREIDLPDESVDVIITDPPYPAEYLPLFDDLAYTASLCLKPGGLLCAMVGQSYLPVVMEKLSEHLLYHWTLAYLTPGGQSSQLWARKVNTFWKPVLCFVKGEYEGDWFGDVAKSATNDNDKEHHFWGQSESGMTDLIERFSKPGDLIFDPFLGGGTTALVATRTARSFIGCDLEEEAVQTSLKRLKAAS